MVVAGGGDDHQLVGVVDHPEPHRVGLVVAGVHQDQPVVLGGDAPDGVDVGGLDPLLVGQDHRLAAEDVELVAGLVVHEVGQVG